jgi:hypothetical protein
VLSNANRVDDGSSLETSAEAKVRTTEYIHPYHHHPSFTRNGVHFSM